MPIGTSGIEGGVGKMEVYTIQVTPFSFGGTHELIKTDVEEYMRVAFGNGYFGILFQNPKTKRYHLALEGCGALLGVDVSCKRLLHKIKNDVLTGDPEIQKEQIVKGIEDCRKARLISFDVFCGRFRK